MKVSVITVCYNSAQTIEDTIKSVINQDYPNIEYIIVDGLSKDNTLEIVNKHKDKIAKIVSEKDNGIYDAINKGIELASGELLSVLNSDDFFATSSVVSDVVESIAKENSDSSYGNLLYVNREETSKVLRTWISGEYYDGIFYKGWMPPHPTFFIKKWCYQKYGSFNLNLKSSADYELMLRMLHKNKIKVSYINKILVKMRVGGQSNVSLLNRLKGNQEDKIAWQLNGIKPNWYTLIWKPLSKIPQYFK